MMIEPKPYCVVDGKPHWNFLYEYDFDGDTYTFFVVATSRAEADARMKKIALARYVGQADGRPQSGPCVPIHAPLLVAWRNFWEQRT